MKNDGALCCSQAGANRQTVRHGHYDYNTEGFIIDILFITDIMNIKVAMEKLKT